MGGWPPIDGIDSKHRLTPMDFELSDEQRLIQQTVRDFVDERVLPNAIENDINHHLDLGIIEAWPSSACSGS
jgi:hypothetical protein